MDITNRQSGLGDCLSVFSLLDEERDIRVRSSHKFFNFFKQFNPYVKEFIGGGKCMAEFHRTCDGEGLHLFNKARKSLGFPVLDKPKPFLWVEKNKNIFPNNGKKNIIIGFDVGIEALAQKRFHPRARQFYPEHKETMAKFILDHQDKFNFYEMGMKQIGFEGCGEVPRKIEEGIHFMNNADLFLGMHSGLMHLAAAFDIPSIIVVNFPFPEQIKFPYTENAPDIDWLYPQFKYLHEDYAGGEVLKFGRDGLEQKVFELIS